jgi:hypothetical protein
MAVALRKDYPGNRLKRRFHTREYEYPKEPFCNTGTLV